MAIQAVKSMELAARWQAPWKSPCVEIGEGLGVVSITDTSRLALSQDKRWRLRPTFIGSGRKVKIRNAKTPQKCGVLVYTRHMSLGLSRNQRRWRKSDWTFWEEATKSVAYCGDKICYKSEEDAQAKIDAQSHKWSKALRMYQCQHCAQFHLTSRLDWSG